MDFTDGAVFGRLTGVGGGRWRGLERDDTSGRRGEGRGQCVGGGGEGKVFPELGK